jgi:predicted nucleotidyltransferase
MLNEKKMIILIKDTVLKIEPSAEIILFGSRARRDFNEFSDWDFLILVDGKVDASRTDRIRSALYDIELDFGEIISSIVRCREDWNGTRYRYAPLHKMIEHEGVRL